MARTVDYTFYTERYCGTAVAEGAWGHVSHVASAHLDRIRSLVRVTPYGDPEWCEACAICAMAEAVQAWEEAAVEGGEKSESIGSVRVTYASAEEAMPKGLERAMRNACRPWLHICAVVG